jgi:hypothetical protein
MPAKAYSNQTVLHFPSTFVLLLCRTKGGEDVFAVVKLEQCGGSVAATRGLALTVAVSIGGGRFYFELAI